MGDGRGNMWEIVNVPINNLSLNEKNSKYTENIFVSLSDYWPYLVSLS
jgi:hypothetical protein